MRAMGSGGETAGGIAAQRYSPRPLTDGERWTAEALAQLRRRRYRPAAWLAFLAGSLERSRASRSQRPALARQAGAWGLAGGAAWCATCVAARHRADLDPPFVAGLAWWLVVWRMLDWHLGMAEGGDGRPRSRLSPADAVTLARFWLVPALPAAARAGAPLPAVIALGAATDWLDGTLARRTGRTRLGTTADLAFLTTAAVSARRAGRLRRHHAGDRDGAVERGEPEVAGHDVAHGRLVVDHHHRAARVPSIHPTVLPVRKPRSPNVLPA
jgi:hypothetical protein